ncbi:MAG: hypothetical protein LBN30_06780 [Oscillospiraceae bacterium]|jgi:hypothetical protein|nr:hypothetical protein [Oscillospiraceae bacterium]
MNNFTRATTSEITHAWEEYEKGVDFNERIGLFDTVRDNENFFIGKQWEGVVSNGLPTPVFNFLKRVVLFTVASLSTSNLKLHASSLANATLPQDIIDTLNDEFEAILEQVNLTTQLREMLRNAAVDGDGCLYTYWDKERGIISEVVENNRVFFGNTADRRVERQPYIIISSREQTMHARQRARENGCNGEIDADDDARGEEPNPDDRVTVLLRLWRDNTTGTIWASETTRRAVVRPAWDTGLKRYPVTWLCWDYIPENYHGQAMITGLIPNQVFINKLFAMSMLSLMTTAYPKVIYDRTRIANWDNRVGAAIPVLGGDMSSVARIMNPATISPQIAQFIELAVGYTQNFLGATSAALGDVRPDNTSAIIALQKASAVPNEITRQNLYAAMEELGKIYIDFMATFYGSRMSRGVPFDFTRLRDARLSLKLDVGASSYWSEIASMQTLDNLMARGLITLEDYLKRIPDGYVVDKQGLLDKLSLGQ